jgi:hypothetical protein
LRECVARSQAEQHRADPGFGDRRFAALHTGKLAAPGSATGDYKIPAVPLEHPQRSGVYRRIEARRK